jgi:hypothetical protein
MADDADRVDALEQDMRAYREQFIKPQLSKLQDSLDDALDRLDEVEAANEQLQARVEQLDIQVENLIGVDDEDLSTHDKRTRDVRAAMIRRAEAKADKRSDNIEGKVALYYKEIQDLLADHGHGQIHREQAHRIMDDIVNVDGFTEGTKSSDHGNDVKAILLNLAALPAYARRNNVTTPDTKAGGEMAEKHAEERNPY